MGRAAALQVWGPEFQGGGAAPPPAGGGGGVLW
jgi:hypothetical protein